MSKRSRGRPKGLTGTARILSDAEIRRALRFALKSAKFAHRDVVILTLSLRLGLSISELAGIVLNDVYDDSGVVRNAITLPSRQVDIAGTETRRVLADYWERQELWAHFPELKIESAHQALSNRTGSSPMTRKSLFAVSLLLPLVGLSGAAYAGPQWNPTMAPWNSAPSLNQTQVPSKPYAQYVAPRRTDEAQSGYRSVPNPSRVQHYQR